MVKVELISHTPEPEKTIIRACRTCYQSFDKQDDVSDSKLLRHITKNNESPLEFANFTFLVSGISRVTSHQMVRHRVGCSYAQKSQRYVAEGNFDYIMPPGVEENPSAREEFKKAIELTKDIYNRLRELGIRKEDCRYILPQACATQIMIGLNGRSLRHFLRLRLSSKAQWEIREVAAQMLDAVRKLAPTLVFDL
ncbi:MAG: FAD-dependent thymidylate synthase [Thermodesulfobacteriota bacterium]